VCVCPAVAVADVIYYYHFPRRRSSVFLRGITVHVQRSAFVFSAARPKAIFCLSLSLPAGGRTSVQFCYGSALCYVFLVIALSRTCSLIFKDGFIRVVPISSFNLILLFFIFFYFPSATVYVAHPHWSMHDDDDDGDTFTRRRSRPPSSSSSPFSLSSLIATKTVDTFVFLLQLLLYHNITCYAAAAAALALNYFSISHQHFLILPHTHWHTHIFNVLILHSKNQPISPEATHWQKNNTGILFLLIFLSLEKCWYRWGVIHILRTIFLHRI